MPTVRYLKHLRQNLGLKIWDWDIFGCCMMSYNLYILYLLHLWLLYDAL